MQHSKIEWLRGDDGKPGYSVNPVKGLCPADCKDAQGKPYCYARRLYKRFHWDETIGYVPEVFEPLFDLKQPSRIFVGSTMELFGPWVKAEHRDAILKTCALLDWHTFMFLTKRAGDLPREWPGNCWVGVSATNAKMVLAAGRALERLDASVKFLSLEPLLCRIGGEWLEDWLKARTVGSGARVFDWLIIGAQTPYSAKTAPPMEWVQEILVAANNAGTPVFMKNNLRPALNNTEIPGWTGFELRQEFPKLESC